MKFYINIGKLIGGVLFLSLVACATRQQPAPIINATQVPNYPVLATPLATTVESVQSPSLKALPDDNSVQVSSNESPATVAKDTKVVTSGGDITFLKPTDGVMGAYSVSSKGVNITGALGQPILAAQSGKVLYSGSGLKGYGNLIIIKHDNGYLSAYAYNQTNYVKEGDVVKRGQKIAAMGKSSSKPTLHFEIRKSGKPLDPAGLIGN